MNQTRTHNAVNEITGISESGGDPWIDPAYDARGNMTAVPKPTGLDLAGGQISEYDACNRLTDVTRGSNGRQVRIRRDQQAGEEAHRRAVARRAERCGRVSAFLLQRRVADGGDETELWERPTVVVGAMPSGKSRFKKLLGV